MKAILIIGLAMLVMSCDKECEEPTIEGCSDSVPTGVTCQAYFESWLYNSSTNNCELTGYSGCGPVGFATEQECEECECHK
jgi:hypothetical protein